MGRVDGAAAELRTVVAEAAGLRSDSPFVREVVNAVVQLPAFQRYRDLRWKFKNMAKASGKQGATIYELRCQLAELRGLMDSRSRAEARREEIDEDSAGERGVAVERQLRTIKRLQDRDKILTSHLEARDRRIKALEDQVAGLESKLALARQVRDNAWPYAPYFPTPPADVPKAPWGAHRVTA